jgi:1-acyl-sn-glycerol-3-phosphate acyltransferase
MHKQARTHVVLRELLCAAVRILVGAYRAGALPSGYRQRIYFANHSSHLDTLTLLAALPLRARLQQRPVAARDYWRAGKLRQWVAEKVLNVVFIDRIRQEDEDPLKPVHAALKDGYSLIFFPEGTRNQDEMPRPFKSGLYHLAQAHAAARLTPVYLENLYRILPKGSCLPVPLINKVQFGEVMPRVEGEGKADFLARAHALVCGLAPRR